MMVGKWPNRYRNMPWMRHNKFAYNLTDRNVKDEVQEEETSEFHLYIF